MKIWYCIPYNNNKKKKKNQNNRQGSQRGNGKIKIRKYFYNMYIRIYKNNVIFTFNIGIYIYKDIKYPEKKPLSEI